MTSSYAIKIENLRTCKSEQDRLATIVEALATAQGVSKNFEVDFDRRLVALLDRKIEELMRECEEEYKLLDELEKLRQDPENLK
jgi:hypothetical protein